MNNVEEQENEMLALSSIYEDAFTEARTETGSCLGGELKILLDSPVPFSIKPLDKGKHTVVYVENLPPLYLHFTFPSTYPTSNPPKFTLSCKWLTRFQLTRLCHHLDKIWQENEGEVILYKWIQFLKEKTLPFLNIHNCLILETVLPTCNFSSRLNLDYRAVQDAAPDADILCLLVEHDAEMRMKKFNESAFLCKVCFTEKSGSSCIEFWPCRHVYCKYCMKMYFEVQINDGNIKSLLCPDEQCQSEANPRQVQELVSEKLYKKWDEMLLVSTLSSMDDIQLCPRSHCQYPVTVERDQGECPSCKFVFCTLCRCGWHGVEPCKLKSGELRKVIDSYINGSPSVQAMLEERYGQKYMLKLKNEYLSECYLDENAKKCPRCGAHIEKIDGCNKVICKNCNMYFCWLCLRLLDKNQPYEHFNSPESQCYNQLFYGAYMGLDYWGEEEEEEEEEDDRFR